MMRPRYSVSILLSLFLLGCKTVPEGRSAVDEIAIRGASKLESNEIEEKIATTESQKFVGLFRGVVYDYSLFDRNVFQADLARIEAFYRSKGYYDAHARAGRVHWVDKQHIRVELVIEEGDPVVVRGLAVRGLEGMKPEVARAAEDALASTLLKDKPFDQEVFEKALGAVRRALSDRGFAWAKATNKANVDIVARKADVVVEVTPGPECTFGGVTIEGLDSIPEGPVRRAIDIQSGKRYSEAELDRAQQALLDLGVFASVDIGPDKEKAAEGTTVIPIKVKVEPSRLRTIRLGGGFEFDALKTDVHGIVGWENRNFLGGLRTLTINFKPGIVFYPMRINNIVAPNRFLPEERLRVDFRQPGFLEARTNGFIRPELNVQALLLDSNPPPNARVIGYAELRGGAGVERNFGRFYAAVSENGQVAYPFAYVGSRDPTLGLLLISYPELVTQLDLRDNRIHPRKGVWLGNTFQFAGGPFGGQADDVKIQPDVRGYVPITRRLVLATRASVGLLYPRNYGRVVRSPQSVFDPSEERTRDYQLTFFRGFFSGGPTSNRGYPLRGVSPHDIVPFLSPESEIQKLSVACGGEYDCRTPTGGFTLWETSVELRYNVTGPLFAATFCDASDVSPHPTDIRLKHLHLSCGVGGRYDTPVGPIRLDVGYRIPGMQVIGGLTPDEREPRTFPLGIPIAVAFGIGEAY